MGIGASSSIRYTEYIDIYLKQPDCQLLHCWTNPETNWNRCSEVLANDCSGRPAAIRHENSIDVYYRNNGNQLAHLWMGDYTGWQHQKEVIAGNLSPAVDPVAVRFNQAIDVFYVSGGGELTHLNAGQHTRWVYHSNVIATGNYSHLCLLRTSEHVIDLFYILDGIIRHRSAGTYSDWVYCEEQTLKSAVTPHCGALSATRFGDYIDVFYRAGGLVRQAHMSPDTSWKLTDYGAIHPNARADSELKALRFEDNIDVYYTADGRVFHSYNGTYSGWNWMAPVPISDADYRYGLTAVRIPAAIDVFYVNNENKLRGLCIGEGTGGDWSAYRYVEPRVSNRRQIKWEDIVQRGGHVLLGEGWHGFAYRVTIDGEVYVAKKYKRPDFNTMEKEMLMLEHVDRLWPGMLFAELTNNSVLAGFIIKFFGGRRINDWIKDPQMRADQLLRQSLVVEVGAAVSALQQINVCHSDLNVDNVLAIQKTGYRWEVHIIDFGNAIVFDKDTRTNSTLTGWAFMRPAEYSPSGYNPVGVNGHQFAWLAMCILALKDGSTYKTLGSRSQMLDKVKRCGCNKGLLQYIENLVRETDPFARIVSGSRLRRINATERLIAALRPHHDSIIVGPKPPKPPRFPIFIQMMGQGGQAFQSSGSHKAYIKDNLKIMAQLAHLLGFAWCNEAIADQPDKFKHTVNGNFEYQAQSVEQIRGQEYTIVDYVTQYDGQAMRPAREIPIYGFVDIREGERSQQRLKIVFQSFQNVVTERKVVNQVMGAEVPMERYEEQIDHRIKASLQSGYEKTYKSHTKIEVVNEETSTFESEVSGKFGFSTQILGFGVEFQMEVRAMRGTEIKKGTTVQTEDASELKISKKLVMEDRGKAYLRMQVYGRNVLNTCRITVLNRCTVVLKGWLRNDHYHRNKRAKENAEYIIGREGKPFQEFLREEIAYPEYSEWDWERLFREKPESRPLIENLIKGSKKSTDIMVSITKGIKVKTITAPRTHK